MALYVESRRILHDGTIEKIEDEKKFWEIFHAGWGDDRGDGERRPDYNKSAWMSVQAKMQNLFSKKNK